MTKQLLPRSACPEQVNTAALSLWRNGVSRPENNLSVLLPNSGAYILSGPSSGIFPEPGGRGDMDVLFKIRALYSH